MPFPPVPDPRAIPEERVRAAAGVRRASPVLVHVSMGTLLLGAVAATGLGFWGTSCHVRSEHGLRDRAAILARLPVKSVPATALDPADVGRVLHTSGTATASDVVTDHEVGVVASALVLERSVSMYQWIETCETRKTIRAQRVGPALRKLAGEDEPVNTPGARLQCNYVKGWRDTRQPVQPASARVYSNPEFPIAGGTTRRTASAIQLGAFRISSVGLVEEVPTLESVPLTLADVERLPRTLRDRARVEGGGVRVGDPAIPQIGDLQIAYRARFAMPVSAVGRFDGWALTPFELPDGSSFVDVREGTYSASEMMGRYRQRRDHWMNHVILSTFVAFGMGLAFWPLRTWGRLLPGPALLTGGGPLLFVPLATAVVYGLNLARLWWPEDRAASVYVLLGAGAALAVLLLAGAVRSILLARPQPPLPSTALGLDR